MRTVQRVALATMALVRLIWQHRIVAKFGGTSMASAENIHRVRDIITTNPLIRWVVVSAPGRRNTSDTKVTDLLLQCHELARAGKEFNHLWSQVVDRFTEITLGLCKTLDLTAELEAIRSHIKMGASQAYVASRGEYLASQIMAAVLGWQWIDAAEVIRFRADGQLDIMRTFLHILALCGQGGVVIGGFYGSLPDGSIHTFPRGGSDITGSVLAAALRVESYENWTDVQGVFTADPNGKGNGAQHISKMTTGDFSALYQSTGAEVVNMDAVRFAAQWGVTIQVRCTFEPHGRSTCIIPPPRRTQRQFARAA